LHLGAFLGGGVMAEAEIVQAVYDRLGVFSKKEAAELVDLVFELMKETLGRGEKIKVSGFGNFVLRDKRKRQGRNPQTGEPIEITERRVLNFKASQILKQVLNQDRPPARPLAHDGEGAGGGVAAEVARSNGNGNGHAAVQHVGHGPGANGYGHASPSVVSTGGLSSGAAVSSGATHLAAASSGQSSGRMS